MAWTTPRTWVAGETVTAAIMNTHVRDNLEAVDPTVVTRAAGIVVVAAGTYAASTIGSRAVVFPEAFAAVPAVTAVGDQATITEVYASAASTTGFTLYFNVGANTVELRLAWMAMAVTG